MGCCGQKRTALASSTVRTAAPPATPPARNSAPPAAPGLVALRYLASSRILVRGPATGQAYEFSGAQPVRAVDPRDAEVLLRTRHFRRT
jgi:hypothetical protein